MSVKHTWDINDTKNMQQPIVQYQELMNATIDTALQRPTWGRKLSPYGQPGAENYRHSFLPQVGRGTSSIRSHLGKSSRKYRWPRRKCLEEIYKRSKGKQKVIWPRSNVLQQLCWTIYLTWLSWDELVITLRSRSFEIIHIFFKLQKYSLWTLYPRGTLVFSLQLFFSVLCLCHNQLQRKISVD